MTEILIPLIAFLVLPIVLLFGFTGCIGEDPEYVAQLEKERDDLKDKIEDEKEKADQSAQQIANDAAEKDARKYPNVINAEPALVCHWRLSEGETGNAVAPDSAPDTPMNGEYKNLGGVSRSVAGALSLVADPADKAAGFDGIQAYVEVPYHLLLNPPLNFSIEIWLRPEPGSTGTQVIVGSYELSAGKVARGFMLEVEATPPKVRAKVGFGSDETVLEAGLGDGSEHGGWRHVVLTYNVVTKQLRLYVNSDDGTPDQELGGGSLPPVFYVANNSTPLRIAAGQQPASPPSPGLFFKGRVDEVALYNAALDGTAVKHHFIAATSAPL